MRPAALPLALAVTLSLGACAVPPPAGPSVMALPGQGKNFEAFQQDDAACRQFAWQQTGGASPSAAATQSGVGSAVVGTALGAAAGAAIGSLGGAAGAGAVIGGATGLLAGSAVGANNAAAAYGGVQQLYDVSYTQCMFAHGNTVQQPPSGYASYPYPAYPYPAYPYAYPYAYPGYYGPAFFAPSVAIGFGGGWGWHGGGWRGGGWHH
jgi:Glycine-zipper domain